MRFEKKIMFCFQQARVACDGNCEKAWGISSRPMDNDGNYISDSNLPIAPIDPGTYEGGHGKPLSASQFPTKWCVRECERCTITPPGYPDNPLILPKF